MTSPASRFSAAVETAMGLPHPTAIYRAILANTTTVDDGLRGTTYDGDRVAASGSSTHPERMLERRHPGQFPRDAEPDWEHKRGTWGARTDRSADDLLALRRATDRVLDSVAALNAICIDAGTPDTWDEALQDADTLLEAGYLEAAMDVGRNVEYWMLRFGHAIDTVRAIRDSWMPHDAPQGLAEENHAWCRNHQRIGIPRERVTRLLCQWCWRHVQDLEALGAPVELQTNPHTWPSEAMMQAKEDGRSVLYEKEWNTWLRSHGLNPTAVHQRRQERRSA